MAGKSQGQIPHPAFSVKANIFQLRPLAGRHCVIRLLWSPREPSKLLLICINLGKLVNFPHAPSPVPFAWRTSFICVLCVCLPILPASRCIWGNFPFKSMGSVIRKIVEGVLMTLTLPFAALIKPGLLALSPQPAPERGCAFAVKKNWQPKN